MSPRAPGITFEVQPPPVPDVLPRMDVAGFVGFAARGPLNVPVPVEDVARFRDVFGGTVDLAWDPETGRTDRAYLLPAVETFFRHGGRRCWVVRVARPVPRATSGETSTGEAGEEAPARNREPLLRSRFRVPGLIPLIDRREAPLRLGRVQARSQGSSFDGLRVGSLLRIRTLPTASLRSEEGNWILSWPTPEEGVDPDLLRKGDLLRTRTRSGLAADVWIAGKVRTRPGKEAEEEKEEAFVPVSEPAFFESDRSPLRPIPSDELPWTVELAGEEEPAFELDREGDGFVLEGEVPDATLRLATGPVLLAVTAPAGRASITLEIEATREEGRWIAHLRAYDLPVEASAGGGSAESAPGSADPESVRLHVEVDEEGRAEGYALRVAGRTHLVPAPGEIVTLRPSAATPEDGEEGWPVAVHVGDGTTVRDGVGGVHTEVAVREARWRGAPDESELEAFRLEAASEAEASESDGPISLERLRFDLLVWEDRSLIEEITDLGFAREDARGWMRLPTDLALFGPEERGSRPAAPPWPDRDVDAPRVSVAGLPETEGRWIPLGMTDRPDPARTHGRIAEGGSPAERDGLDAFDPTLFVDDALAGSTTGTLARRATDLVEVDEVPANGLHALWTVREVTLLALPDAVHRPWRREPPLVHDPVPVPRLEVPTLQTGAPPTVELTWSVEEGAPDAGAPFDYEVEESVDLEFSAPVRHAVSGEEVGGGTEGELTRYIRNARPRILYFRVRAVEEGRVGGWSATRRVAVPDLDFTRCSRLLEPPAEPSYRRGAGPDGADLLRFRPVESDAPLPVGYRVEISSDPSFVRAERHEIPPEPADEETERISFPLPPERPPLLYARVRGFVGEPSGPGDAGSSGEGGSEERAGAASGEPVEVGPWSRTVALVRALEPRETLVPPAEYDRPSPDADWPGRPDLLDLQGAALRFAAARGDVVAVLALPAHDRTQRIETHLRRLTTPGITIGYDELRTLSFGALYHPWIVPGRGTDAAVGELPPHGAAIGAIAGRTLERGAWAAPANVVLRGIRQVSPDLSADTFEAERCNLIRSTGRGVLTMDAVTLSGEEELRPLHARRLLNLLRRLVEREGPALVFEDNDAFLRRRIVDQFESLLARLFRLGALAGSTPSEAYRVVADDSVNPPSARDLGRLVVELRVAPNRPLRFVTVRLVRRGTGALIPEGG